MIEHSLLNIESKNEVEKPPSFRCNACQLSVLSTHLVIEHDMVVSVLLKRYYPVGKAFEKDQTKGGVADFTSL